MRIPPSWNGASDGTLQFGFAGETLQDVDEVLGRIRRFFSLGGGNAVSAIADALAVMGICVQDARIMPVQEGESRFV